MVASVIVLTASKTNVFILIRVTLNQLDAVSNDVGKVLISKRKQKPIIRNSKVYEIISRNFLERNIIIRSNATANSSFFDN